MAASTNSVRLEGIIELKDKYSDKMGKIIEETKKAKEEMKKVKPIIEAKDKASEKIRKVSKATKLLNKVKAVIKLQAKDEATAKANRIKREMAKLKAKRIAITIIDKAKGVIDSIALKLKKIRGKRFRIKADDKASGSLGGIIGMLGKIHPLAIAAGGALAGIGAGAFKALKSGAVLEQQTVSMEHFMKVGNKNANQQQIKQMTQGYMSQLKDNANATPFSTGEVISTGTRALTIAGGNSAEAMRLVKLAEDMSASDPNKSLGDAIEALADAKMGEFERLKEFGFKGSKENFDKAGGDFFKMKGTDGNTLMGTFGGLAEKQSRTAMGAVSTIGGNLSTATTDLGSGMLEGLNPSLQKIKTKIQEALGGDDNAQKIQELGNKIGNGLIPVIDGVIKGFDFLNKAGERIGKNIDFEAITNAFKPAIEVVKYFAGIIDDFVNKTISGSPEVEGVFQGIGATITFVFQAAGTIASFAAGVIKSAFDAIVTAIKWCGDRIDDLKNAWQWLKDTVNNAVNAIGSVVNSVFGVIRGVINGVKSAINAVGEAWTNLKKKIENNPIVQTISRVFTGGDDGGTPTQNSTGRRHAYGGRIPRNNYPVRLHEGEQVLTKNEANKREGNADKNNINITINATVREEADINKIVDEIVRQIKNNKS